MIRNRKIKETTTTKKKVLKELEMKKRWIRRVKKKFLTIKDRFWERPDIIKEELTLKI